MNIFICMNKNQKPILEIEHFILLLFLSKAQIFINIIILIVVEKFLYLWLVQYDANPKKNEQRNENPIHHHFWI